MNFMELREGYGELHSGERKYSGLWEDSYISKYGQYKVLDHIYEGEFKTDWDQLRTYKHGVGLWRRDTSNIQYGIWKKNEIRIHLQAEDDENEIWLWLEQDEYYWELAARKFKHKLPQKLYQMLTKNNQVTESEDNKGQSAFVRFIMQAIRNSIIIRLKKHEKNILVRYIKLRVDTHGKKKDGA